MLKSRESAANIVANGRITVAVSIILQVVYLVAFIYAAANLSAAAFWVYLTLSILTGVTLVVLVGTQVVIVAFEKYMSKKESK